MNTQYGMGVDSHRSRRTVRERAVRFFVNETEQCSLLQDPILYADTER